MQDKGERKKHPGEAGMRIDNACDLFDAGIGIRNVALEISGGECFAGCVLPGAGELIICIDEFEDNRFCLIFLPPFPRPLSSRLFRTHAVPCASAVSSFFSPYGLGTRQQSLDVICKIHSIFFFLKSAGLGAFGLDCFLMYLQYLLIQQNVFPAWQYLVIMVVPEKPLFVVYRLLYLFEVSV